LPRNAARPPDDLDEVLRAFFRAELPDPWPALKVPARPVTRPKPSSTRRPFWGSRFALAATVGLCLAGSALLGSVFPAGGPAVPVAPEKGNDVASGLRETRHFKDKTPSGRTVRGVEVNEGRKTTIKIEVVDTGE
jgi:hypothetical protein